MGAAALHSPRAACPCRVQGATQFSEPPSARGLCWPQMPSCCSLHAAGKAVLGPSVRCGVTAVGSTAGTRRAEASPSSRGVGSCDKPQGPSPGEGAVECGWWVCRAPRGCHGSHTGPMQRASAVPKRCQPVAASSEGYRRNPAGLGAERGCRHLPAGGRRVGGGKILSMQKGAATSSTQDPWAVGAWQCTCLHTDTVPHLAAPGAQATPGGPAEFCLSAHIGLLCHTGVCPTTDSHSRTVPAVPQMRSGCPCGCSPCTAAEPPPGPLPRSLPTHPRHPRRGGIIWGNHGNPGMHHAVPGFPRQRDLAQLSGRRGVRVMQSPHPWSSLCPVAPAATCSHGQDPHTPLLFCSAGMEPPQGPRPAQPTRPIPAAAGPGRTLANEPRFPACEQPDAVGMGCPVPQLASLCRGAALLCPRCSKGTS